MLLPLFVSNVVFLMLIVLFIVLSIVPYFIAKNNYDYNIYNMGNVGVIFAGMIGLFLIVIFSGGMDGMEEVKQSLMLLGIVVLITTSIVFIRTLKNTNLMIAVLSIIPQIIISVIIYLITKLVYNIIFKPE